MKQKRNYEQARMTAIELSSMSQLLAASEQQPVGPISGNSNTHLVAMGTAGTLE